MTSFRCTYKNQIFFGLQVMAFSRDPSQWCIGSYVPFQQGSHKWKQYHQGLLYAPDPENAKERCWVISPDYRVSHPRHFCAAGDAAAQRYMSFGNDLETHAIWQGYVEDPNAKGFVARKARTIALSKAQESCHKTSNNQPHSRVWKSLGNSIPKLYCVALQGLCHARKCQFEDFSE